jgi:hypothetical protein
VPSGFEKYRYAMSHATMVIVGMRTAHPRSLFWRATGIGNVDGSVLVFECGMVILADGREDGRREHFGSSLIGEWAADLNGAILMAAESCGEDVGIEFAEADHARGVEGIVDVGLPAK